MPPVYDVAAGQEHYKIVDAVHKGKAMRLALGNAELANQAQQQQNDAFDEIQAREQQKVDIAQQGADTDAGKLQLAVEKEMNSLGDEDRQSFADANAAALESYQQNGDIDIASKALHDALISKGYSEKDASVEFHPDSAAATVATQDNYLKNNAPKDPASDYTIGDTRYSGATNQPLATNPKQSDGSRQRDDEIRDTTKILEGMGIPNAAEEAIKQVDGKIVFTVDPTGGAIYRTDKITGKTEEVEIKPANEQGDAPVIPYEQTLYALAEEATGIGPGAKDFLSKGLGPIGGYTDKATVAARSKFKSAENTLIRAFSLNPRYPVAEQNRIKENIQIKPKFWDSPELMRARMQGIRSFLEEELATSEYESKRQGIGRKRKMEEENTASDIKRFLRMLGKPKSKAPELSDLPPVPDGVDPELWRHMTPEARSLWN